MTSFPLNQQIMNLAKRKKLKKKCAIFYHKNVGDQEGGLNIAFILLIVVVVVNISVIPNQPQLKPAFTRA